jgi:hypothetical protein
VFLHVGVCVCIGLMYDIRLVLKVSFADEVQVRASLAAKSNHSSTVQQHLQERASSALPENKFSEHSRVL